MIRPPAHERGPVDLVDIRAPLMGMNEVVRFTGRKLGTVQNWYRRGSLGFPKPYQVIDAGPVWTTGQVLAWLGTAGASACAPGSQAEKFLAELDFLSDRASI